MKRFLLASLGALLAIAPLNALRAADAQPNQLTEVETAAGWKLLFDGKDASTNWRGYKKETLPASWKTEDGVLNKSGKGGDIITKDQFESFELSIDWKISKGGNSGIMFKVQETGQASYLTGPECQIQDNVDGHDPQKAGWMYGLYPATVDTTKPVGEWNTFILKCQKTPTGTFQCEHWMNGTKYCTYEIGSTDWAEKVAKSKFAKWTGFGTSPKGHICLQDHGNDVSFRNIKIRELK